jgi:TolB-like protein/tetratricopeptide (TPR) repeat protein
LAYVLVAWALLSGAEFLLELAETPKWVLWTLIIIAGLGLPAVLIFSWAFEITPEGVKREREVERSESITHSTGKKLDRLIIVGLAVVLIWYVTLDKLYKNEPPAVAEINPATADLAPAQPQGQIEPPQLPTFEKDIAVMPFDDMSPAKDQEHLARGIPDQLLSALGRIAELRVITRSSSFSYEDEDYRIADVGRDLNVAHILEGSIMASGQRVRVTARLTEVATDTLVWSDTYDRTTEDIFAIQDDITNEVVTVLKGVLVKDDTATVAATSTGTDPAAYNLYLKAKELGREYTQESLVESNDLLQQALDIDPDYVSAKFLLGTNKRRLATLDLDTPSPTITSSRSFSAAGRSNDISLPGSDFRVVRTPTIPVWSSDYRRGDLEAMARSLETDLQQRPGNPDAMLGAAMLARDLGRVDDAILFARYVVNQDPANDEAHTNLAHAFLSAGNFNDALASYRYALEMNSDRVGAHYNVGVAHLLMGEPSSALLAFGQESDKDYRTKGMAMAMHTLGDEAGYDKALEQLLDRLGDSWPLDVAEVNAWAGDADGAFDWLAKEMEASGHLVGISSDRIFVSLHDDPRWQPLLAESGISTEQLQAIEFRVQPPETAQ